MKRLVPALLACSAVIAAPVGASTHFMDSSASLTGLQFELIDLRPDDGITPALQVVGKAFVRARQVMAARSRNVAGLQVRPSAPNSWRTLETSGLRPVS